SVQLSRSSHLWIADSDRLSELTQLTNGVGQDDGISGVAWGPNGYVVYTKRVAGSQDIWSIDPNGRNNRQITQKSGSNFHPAVSADGKTIVFTSDRAGSLDLWRMDFDGGNPIRMTELKENESQPILTSDGLWIIFRRSGNDGLSSVWKMPFSGGEPSQLLPAGSDRPQLSPDGKLIACELTNADNGSKKIGIFSFDDGHEIGTYDYPAMLSTSNFRWSGDGKSFIFVNRLDGRFEVWSQPISGGQARRLGDSIGDRIYAFDVSRNGKTMVFSRGTESSDVLIISGIR
ncbi:MAG: TolB family protein, partial [Pyrinomonadaceae bacterium]